MSVQIPVSAEHPYQVIVGDGMISCLADHVGHSRVAVIYSQDRPELAAAVAKALHVGEVGERSSLEDQKVIWLSVPDGEDAKTAAQAVRLWDDLAEARFSRSDIIVGIGGGAVTDLAGFIAATWLRGVGYISVPTSVLAMVDAGVGGKTGINIPAGKNLVGAFYEPKTVVCDLNFLSGLTERDLSSGFAEVIKAGFIADTSILDLVGTGGLISLSGDTRAELIAKAIQVKATVVTSDLKERGVGAGGIGREQLNYGHTLGHAIENREHFRLRHGECVSIGMVFAAKLAALAGLIPDDLVDTHIDILTSLNLPVGYRGVDLDDLMEGIRLDKKTRSGTLRFVVLDRHFGSTRILSDPNPAWLAEAFSLTNALA